MLRTVRYVCASSDSPAAKPSPTSRLCSSWYMLIPMAICQPNSHWPQPQQCRPCSVVALPLMPTPPLTRFHLSRCSMRACVGRTCGEHAHKPAGTQIAHTLQTTMSGSKPRPLTIHATRRMEQGTWREEGVTMTWMHGGFRCFQPCHTEKLQGHSTWGFSRMCSAQAARTINSTAAYSVTSPPNDLDVENPSG